MTEYDFIFSLDGRENSYDCRGPLLSLAFSHPRAATIQYALVHSPRGAEVLRQGDPEGSPEGVTFTLCAAHWMDLSLVTGLYGRVYERRDWAAEGSALLKQICASAHWDVKEIANMIRWRTRRDT